MNGVQSKLKGKDLDFLFEAILRLNVIIFLKIYALFQN